MSMVATGALQSISKEYYEATDIDGASFFQKLFKITLPLLKPAIIDGAAKFQVFTKIMLPLAKPALAITAIFIFTAPWTDYVTSYLFLTDGTKYTLAQGLYSWAADFRSVSWGTFCAGSIIMALPLAVVYLVFQKYIVSGLTAGGVKG